MKLTVGTNLNCSGAKVLSFAARPETKVQYDIDPKHQHPRRKVPQHCFDGVARRVERFLGEIVTEQSRDPLIRCEAKRRTLVLNLPCESGLSGTRQTTNEMQCGDCLRSGTFHRRLLLPQSPNVRADRVRLVIWFFVSIRHGESLARSTTDGPRDRRRHNGDGHTRCP